MATKGQIADRPILLVDDDDNDVFLMRRALELAGIHNALIVAHDGQEAMELLDTDPFNEVGLQPLPALLVLDVKMPRMGGFDVLAWMHDKPDLKNVPAVVLTSSPQERDRAKALELGAAEYHVKASRFMEQVTMVRDLAARWLDSPIPKPRRNGRKENHSETGPLRPRGHVQHRRAEAA